MKKYIALFRTVAVRDVQICRCNPFSEEAAEDDKWFDLSPAEVYIGLFDAKSAEAAVALVAEREGCAEESIRVIEAGDITRFEETVEVPAEEYKRINRLLNIQSLEDMSDEALEQSGAKLYSCEEILAVEFADGSEICFELCSGSINYYDNVVWTGANGRSATLDCSFEFGDVECEQDGVTYIVHIKKT